MILLGDKKNQIDLQLEVLFESVNMYAAKTKPMLKTVPIKEILLYPHYSAYNVTCQCLGLFSVPKHA